MKTKSLPTDGPSLRAYRAARRIKQIEVARKMGKPSSLLCRIERWAVVDPDVSASYVAAVEEIAATPVG